jgi:protein-S-isoprenylcysteine O-methyltransferase Ste14
MTETPTITEPTTTTTTTTSTTSNQTRPIEEVVVERLAPQGVGSTLSPAEQRQWLLVGVAGGVTCCLVVCIAIVVAVLCGMHARHKDRMREFEK